MPRCLGRAGRNIFYENRKKSIAVEIFFSWICLIVFFEMLAITLKIPMEEHRAFHQMIGWVIDIYSFW